MPLAKIDNAVGIVVAHRNAAPAVKHKFFTPSFHFNESCGAGSPNDLSVSLMLFWRRSRSVLKHRSLTRRFASWPHRREQKKLEVQAPAPDRRRERVSRRENSDIDICLDIKSRAELLASCVGKAGAHPPSQRCFHPLAWRENRLH